MDESIATVVLNCGGRGYLVFTGTFGSRTINNIPADIFEHFFYSLCNRAGITTHIAFTGKNDIITSARRRSRHSGLRSVRRCP
ncbi:MAG: hypothetical protein WC620_03870 [Methanoregula sp.]